MLEHSIIYISNQKLLSTCSESGLVIVITWNTTENEPHLTKISSLRSLSSSRQRYEKQAMNIVYDWLLYLKIPFSRFIHILVCISTAVLFIVGLTFSCMDKPHLFIYFIHQSRETYIVFTYLASMYNDAKTFICKFLCGHMFLFTLGIVKSRISQ